MYLTHENFLKNYKNTKNIIVEIGVRSGASLKLWSEYFSKDSKIYGLDNLVDKNQHAVPVNENWINEKNIEYIIGDAYTEEIANKFDEITILIDDGPHSIESHIKLIELYSSKMQKGGAIIIEDVGYDPVGLLPFVKDELKEKFSFYDYGIHCDNKIILFQFSILFFLACLIFIASIWSSYFALITGVIFSMIHVGYTIIRFGKVMILKNFFLKVL